MFFEEQKRYTEEILKDLEIFLKSNLTKQGKKLLQEISLKDLKSNKTLEIKTLDLLRDLQKH